MVTYKLFRLKQGKLFPLYVNANEEVKTGKWLQSKPGELKDENHVKSRLGGLSLRSGWHSTYIPFTDWIGKKMDDGSLARRKNEVWCECEVKGNEIETKIKNGYKVIPKDSYYFFKTNSKQENPWIISDWIYVKRILKEEEVKEICKSFGVEAQKVLV